MSGRQRKSPFQRVSDAAHRSRAPLILMAAFAWLAMAAIVAAFLYGERREVRQRAERDGGALALALEAHTVRTFEAVDIALEALANRLHDVPGLPKNDPAFQRTLTARLEALHPYVRSIIVIGPDGRIMHDTNHPFAPDDISLKDRD